MPAKPIAKIRCAAAYFALVSRHPVEIAVHFDVSTRTIHRWAADPEWEQTLDFLHYNADRSFEVEPRRNIVRDTSDLFIAARHTYQKAILDGHPPHKWARITADATGLTQRRIRNWAKQFQWADTQKENSQKN